MSTPQTSVGPAEPIATAPATDEAPLTAEEEQQIAAQRRRDARFGMVVIGLMLGFLVIAALYGITQD